MEKTLLFFRKSWNFVSDNFITKPFEGVQVVGYLLYGSFYLAPKEMIKQGKVGDMHVPMEMTLWGFKNGSFGKTLEYKDGRTVMSETEKFQKIAMPGVEAMTLNIGLTFKPFKSSLLNWGVNTILDDGMKSAISTAIPK